jgi:hypothetical protein
MALPDFGSQWFLMNWVKSALGNMMTTYHQFEFDSFGLIVLPSRVKEASETWILESSIS